jgi:hypothetical protein
VNLLSIIAAGIGGLAVGASLGFLGAGGTILTLPLLLALGVAPGPAIASSLAVVAVIAGVAAAAHARAGRVDLRAAVSFGPATALGGYAGGRAAGWIEVEWLLLGFEVLMVLAALAMLRPPLQRQLGSARPVRMLVVGGAIGALAGLVGAGGGFLYVPALSLLGGLPVSRAIGTSLVVICANSLAALLGHLEHVVLPSAEITLPLAASAAIGALLGARRAQRTTDVRLRRIFAAVVLLVAAAMFARSLCEAPGGSRPAPDRAYTPRRDLAAFRRTPCSTSSWSAESWWMGRARRGGAPTWGSGTAGSRPSASCTSRRARRSTAPGRSSAPASWTCTRTTTRRCSGILRSAPPRTTA